MDESRIEIDLSVKTIPVDFKTKDTETGAETTLTYHLRELFGDERGQFLDYADKHFRRNRDGKIVGSKNIGGQIEKMLGMCLYDENGKLAQLSFIRKIPGMAQETLFNRAMELNGFDGTEKNE